ncbi:MAG: hypothetical protein ACUVXI_02435 [bacterium]
MSTRGELLVVIINYPLYARVLDIRQVYRWQLFPEHPCDEKSNKRYYQIFLQPLQRLPHPIVSRRRQRIVFIPTTWQKFINAVEVNDLYDESSLEDRLWAEFKLLQIRAERQEFVTVKSAVMPWTLPFTVMKEYCLTTIIENINNLGGVDECGITESISPRE